MCRHKADISNPAHNHTACITSALSSAERLCQNRGVRLTPLRRRVLEKIWQNHEAIKAYELIHQLSSADHTVKPPTVYRALDFLLAQGLIHRIESLNGFVGCTNPDHEHDCLMLICRKCGVVTEMENGTISQEVAAQASRQGFMLERQIMEGRGLCAHCRDDDEARDTGQ